MTYDGKCSRSRCIGLRSLVVGRVESFVRVYVLCACRALAYNNLCLSLHLRDTSADSTCLSGLRLFESYVLCVVLKYYLVTNELIDEYDYNAYMNLPWAV